MAGDLAELDMYFDSRHFCAQVLPWVGWVHFLLQILPDSKSQSVLVKQIRTSQVSLLKLMPRQVLDKNFEQVHSSEPDSKEKRAFSSEMCCVISTIRGEQQKWQQLQQYLILLVQNKICHSS